MARRTVWVNASCAAAAAWVAAAALAAWPAAAQADGPLAGRTEIGATRGYLPSTGPDAGRLVLDVPVRYAELPASAAARADDAVATFTGTLRVRLVGRTSGRLLATVRDRNPLLLRAPGVGVTLIHRVVLPRTASDLVTGTRSSGRIGLGLAARGVLNLDDDRAAEDSEGDAEAQRSVPWTRVAALPAVARPRCARFEADVNYERGEPVVVTCMGEDVDLRIASQPDHGSLGAARDAGGILRVTYRPDAGYVGRDGFTVAATTAAASAAAIAPTPVELSVQPFKLRAFGDSIASGWGIYANGEQMSALRLTACRPKAAPSNNACSANAPGRDGAAGAPQFLPDYGYGNAAAWPAQLARRLGLTRPGQFKNLAVAGAHAEDWDRGQPYRPLLDSIVADSPDLVVASLGANPLLSTVLIGSGALCAALPVASMQQCVRRYIDQVGIEKHMASILTDVVNGARNAQVVLALYHTAVPAISTFKYYESEWILGQVNAELEAAVRTAKARLGTDGARRLLVMRPPRFNVGMPLRNVNGTTIGNGGPLDCGSTPFTKVRVDGASRQADISQWTLKGLNPREFCGSSYLGSDKRPWTVEGDLGIHLSQAGAEVFAQAVLALPVRRP